MTKDIILTWNDVEPVEIAELKRLDALYRDGNPEVTDEVYNALYNEAKKKYPNDDFFKEVHSETIEEGNEVELPIIMGSLRNIHNETFSEWAAKNPSSMYVAMYKLDGVSIVVKFVNRELVFAATRGDGYVGQNILSKAKNFMPTTLPERFPDEVILRGEMMLNVEADTLGYANKRNAVTGIVGRHDHERDKYITPVFYELVKLGDIKTQDIMSDLNIISKMGLEVVPYELVNGFDNVQDIANYLENKLQAHTHEDYLIDGYVICPNNYKREDSKYPTGKVAYKRANETYETTVIGITSDTGRTGKVTPVINIEPVQIGGVTVSNATAHNPAFIRDTKLVVGCKVTICRTDEVIPYIVSVNSDAEAGCIPESCPGCGGELAWNENNVELYCYNPECPPQVIKRIAWFFKSLGLEEFSETSFASLGVKSIMDVFNLTYDDIIVKEGWGESSTNDFIKRVIECKNALPEDFIAGISIPGIGTSVSKWITSKYTLDELWNVTPDQLLKIEGIGEGRANLICEWISEHKEYIDELLTYVSVESAIGSLSGKTFCITGSLSTPRKNIEADIKNHGGTIGGLNRKTPEMYLVCNNESTSSKYKKALQYGIPIITELQLNDMMQNK